MREIRRDDPSLSPSEAAERAAIEINECIAAHAVKVAATNDANKPK